MSIKWLGESSSNNNKSQAGNLVARYVWNGNKVIQPISLDLTTGIFTTSISLNNLGFSTGYLYNTFFVMHSWSNKILPQEINPVTDYYMYILSDTTFQLSTSNSSSGAVTSYPSTSNTSVDVSEFHFEYATIPQGGLTIDISGLNLSDILVRYDITGRDRSGYYYIYLEGNGDEGKFSSYIGTIIDGRETMSICFDLRWKYNLESKIIWGWVEHAQSIQWGNNTNGTWINGNVNGSSQTNQWRNWSNFQMTGINSKGIPMANGSVIEIYDMKGGY